MFPWGTPAFTLLNEEMESPIPIGYYGNFTKVVRSCRGMPRIPYSSSDFSSIRWFRWLKAFEKSTYTPAINSLSSKASKIIFFWVNKPSFERYQRRNFLFYLVLFFLWLLTTLEGWKCGDSWKNDFNHLL